MKNNKTDNDEPGVEITEQPTGEYLALGDNGEAAAPRSAEPSGTARAPAEAGPVRQRPLSGSRTSKTK